MITTLIIFFRWRRKYVIIKIWFHNVSLIITYKERIQLKTILKYCQCCFQVIWSQFMAIKCILISTEYSTSFCTTLIRLRRKKSRRVERIRSRCSWRDRQSLCSTCRDPASPADLGWETDIVWLPSDRDICKEQCPNQTHSILLW